MTEELRNRARALGLGKLAEEHLAQFERATNGMRQLLNRVPRDVPASHEPAHVYHAKGEAPKGETA